MAFFNLKGFNKQINKANQFLSERVTGVEGTKLDNEFSEMEKQIIFNSLQESLSTYYLLASQKSFEAAQEKAFEELDYEECTEDQCFALIQQILQVDNLFLFSMTREGTFNQLSLTRVDLDSQRLVRTAICEDCGIGDLNSKVDGLVQDIFEAVSYTHLRAHET